ncbi:hypothetical protein WJX72_001375 [[Myrmecia] bisecta]|uniref:Protein KTI12 homolog n=1 Tax=[Myrmecia] bisecta TaxID=41462 RepID=A0AAW1QE56_9CHLO
MPLVLICGQPCSGKSRVAAALREHFLSKGQQAVIVDEPSQYLDKNSAYQDSASEKNTRGTLKAATDRSLTKGTVVILDSLNNIKGYRYELYCIARAAGTRYCVVHCDAPVEQAREWNRARPEPTYTEDLFNNLAGRFETPDSRNRWDAPLFTLHPGGGSLEAELEQVVAAITEEPSAAPKAGISRELKPTSATTNPALSATNLLYEIDKASQDVITRITEAQTQACGGAAGRVDLGEGQDSLQLQRAVPLPELRRHKRAFIKLATQNAMSRVPDAATATRLFVNYLQEQLE